MAKLIDSPSMNSLSTFVRKVLSISGQDLTTSASDLQVSKSYEASYISSVVHADIIIAQS